MDTSQEGDSTTGKDSPVLPGWLKDTPTDREVERLKDEPNQGLQGAILFTDRTLRLGGAAKVAPLFFLGFPVGMLAAYMAGQSTMWPIRIPYKLSAVCAVCEPGSGRQYTGRG